MRVAITTTSFGQHDRKPLALLERQGIDYRLNPYGRKLVAGEIVELAEGAVGLIAGTEALTAQVLGKLPSLKIISRCGAGIDNVDHAAAQKRGIAVLNTPDGPTLAVAELTVGLILDLLRRSAAWTGRCGGQME